MKCICIPGPALAAPRRDPINIPCRRSSPSSCQPEFSAYLTRSIPGIPRACLVGAAFISGQLRPSVNLSHPVVTRVRPESRSVLNMLPSGKYDSSHPESSVSVRWLASPVAIRIGRFAKPLLRVLSEKTASGSYGARGLRLVRRDSSRRPGRHAAVITNANTSVVIEEVSGTAGPGTS
ncbi:hypothetical protein DPEC_G00155420 [Dallia pectoralis]|uniref:Uncharacterized protein n=1 Tax=Dallia pectoralis TaxID=75939 RepID=A0ACC2GKD5_DALPE|nr:hypothetical protein DPEC_G00155420 [Dallia pectoralis]